MENRERDYEAWKEVWEGTKAYNQNPRGDNKWNGGKLVFKEVAQLYERQ